MEIILPCWITNPSRGGDQCVLFIWIPLAVSNVLRYTVGAHWWRLTVQDVTPMCRFLTLKGTKDSGRMAAWPAYHTICSVSAWYPQQIQSRPGVLREEVLGPPRRPSESGVNVSSREKVMTGHVDSLVGRGKRIDLGEISCSHTCEAMSSCSTNIIPQMPILGQRIYKNFNQNLTGWGFINVSAYKKLDKP